MRRFLCLILLCLPVAWFLEAEAQETNTPAANLVKNPSAEEVQGAKPLHWNAFISAGQGPLVWGSLPAGRDGKKCAYLEVPQFALYKGKKYAAASLIPGCKYSPPGAFEAKPDAVYAFSFYAKGDIASGIVVYVRGWVSDQKDAQTQYIPVILKPLRPSTEWQKYEGTFTTLPDTRKFALVFNVSGYEGEGLAKGQRIYLDDVSITEAADAHNIIVREGAAERVILDPIEEETIFSAWNVSGGITRQCETNRAETGKACLRLHFDFDAVGCADYPGVERKVAFRPSDWTPFDAFQFWIKASTPDGSLPGGITLKLIPISGKQAYETILTSGDLPCDKWVRIAIPIQEILNSHGIQSMRLSVRRTAAWRKAKSLDLFLDEIALLRWTAPTVVRVQPLQKVFSPSSRAIPLDIEVGGLNKDQTVSVVFELLKGEKVLAAQRVAVGKGDQQLVLTRTKTIGKQAQQVSFDLTGLNVLIPGNDYVVTARLDPPNAPAVKSEPIKVVETILPE